MSDKRLIDANALNVAVCMYMTENAYLNDTALDVLKKVATWIAETPTIDAVEVVRCRKCMNWQKDWECTRGKPGDHYCTMIDLVTEPDFYCKHGAKMDGGAE